MLDTILSEEAGPGSSYDVIQFQYVVYAHCNQYPDAAWRRTYTAEMLQAKIHQEAAWSADKH